MSRIGHFKILTGIISLLAVSILSVGLALNDYPSAHAAAENDLSLDNVGLVALENSGAPEAQADFLYGLAQLHNFEYWSAADHFGAAIEKDPDFALAYWGKAMTFNHPIWMEQDHEKATEALKALAPNLKRAKAKAKLPIEKDLLEAVYILYAGTDTSEQSKRRRDQDYRAHMKTLYEKYPGHAEIGAFYALSILGTAHAGRDVPTYMEAAAVAVDLVHAYPKHPGAAHYLIHATDDPDHAFLGLDAAKAYSVIAPEAAHAQHMTSHIFLALGMWDETTKANETAMAVVNKARAAMGREPGACGHYNFWLEYSYLQQGRPNDARKLLEECRESTVEAVAKVKGTADAKSKWAASRSYVSMLARYITDVEGWDEVDQWLIDLGDDNVSGYTYDYLRTWAAIENQDSEADQLLAAFPTSIQDVLSGMDELGFPADAPFRPVPAIQHHQLQALASFKAGNQEEALTHAKTARDLEAELPMEFGPPMVDKPTNEFLGDLLLAMGRKDEAADAYQAALLRTRGRLQTLEGLAKASK